MTNLDQLEEIRRLALEKVQPARAEQKKAIEAFDREKREAEDNARRDLATWIRVIKGALSRNESFASNKDWGIVHWNQHYISELHILLGNPFGVRNQLKGDVGWVEVYWQ